MSSGGVGLGAAVVVTAALVLAAIVVPGCAPDERPPRVRKTYLGTLPETVRRGSVAIAPAGDAYAFVSATLAGDRVVGPNGESSLYARCLRPSFLPGDDHRLMYWARTHGEGEERAPYMLVEGDTPVASGFARAGTLVVSEDGAQWAALGVDAANPEPPTLRFHLNGVRQERWTDVSSPLFDDDGVALLARTGAEPTRLVVDGEDVRAFAAPTEPCAAAATLDPGEPELWRHKVQRLADGSLLLMTRDADGWGIYRGDQRLASYRLSTDDRAEGECAENVAALHRDYLRVAADAPVAVWWEYQRVGEEHRWRAMRDGAPLDGEHCEDFERSQPIEIGPAGEHYAYACRFLNDTEHDDIIVFRDGERYGPYGQVWGISLSGDGTHVAYGATPEPGALVWHLYRDGVQQPGTFHGVWRPRLDDSGAHMAWQVQLDEPPEDESTYGVLGLDGVRITDFDQVMWGPEFEDGERVAWVIRRGRRLIRIDFHYGVE